MEDKVIEENTEIIGMEKCLAITSAIIIKH